MSALSIWFLFVFLPNLGMFLCLTSLACFVLVIFMLVEDESGLAGFFGIVSFLSMFVCCAIPSQKEMAAIVLVPYISNNPEFQKLPENLAKYLNGLVEDESKEKK